MEELRIRVKRLHPEARLPARASDWAAGADLHSVEACRLEPGARASVATGLAVEIPKGYYGRVAPRSGLAARYGVDVLAGVIDADYRGELRVLLVNLGPETIELEAGERVAQLILERAAPTAFEWSDELTDTRRADGGFGSTGRS